MINVTLFTISGVGLPIADPTNLQLDWATAKDGLFSFSPSLSSITNITNLTYFTAFNLI
jgi:urea transporter